MAKSEHELEAERRQMAQGPPGGGSSRGPETTTTDATEVQGLLPPYDREESGEAGAQAAEGVRKAFNAEEHGGEPGPPPPVSKQEREGPDYTDMPMGVSGDRRTGSEELADASTETGRHDTAPQGPTRRPAGVSTGADRTGINPSEGHAHDNDATEKPEDIHGSSSSGQTD